MAPRGGPSRDGSDRRSGRRRGASCRTRCDTGPTDPASPIGSRPTIPGRGQRTRRTRPRRRVRRRRRGVGREQRRRSGLTSNGVGTGRAGRTTPRPTRPPTPPRSAPGHRSTRRRGRRRRPSPCANHSRAHQRPRTTVRPSRPTWIVAHRPARSVIAAAGAAMRWSVWVNVITEQPTLRQRNRRFDHTNRARRPKRSTTSSNASSASRSGSPTGTITAPRPALRRTPQLEPPHPTDPTLKSPKRPFTSPPARRTAAPT